MRAAISIAQLLFRRASFPHLPRTFSATASPETDVEVLVIGAGVVGLAVARQLAASGRDVLLVESAGRPGTETSSRNSEVIHAGIYYPPGSLKAKLCVQGKHLLYDYCNKHGIPHRRCGKMLVATTEAQLPKLQELQDNAVKNNVADLQWLTASEAKFLEPEVSCVGALLSPSTGILDSHSFMTSLHTEFESFGGTSAFYSKVVTGDVSKVVKKAVIKDIGAGANASDGDGPGSITTITARYVINAAGLYAQRVASSLKGLPVSSIPPLHLAKGNYFLLRGRAPFQHLIYPMPEPGVAGLGVHLTLDLSGGARFGPDVEWIRPGTNPEDIDYAVDPGMGPAFEAAARTFFPGLASGALDPGYSGVRPKITGPGEPAGDFVISGPAVHGVPGVVSLYGIESPGLTASLALAAEVERCLE